MVIDIISSPKTILLAIGIGLIADGALVLKTNDDILFGVVKILIGIVILYAREYLKSIDGANKKEKDTTESNLTP